MGCFEHDIPIPGKSYKRYVPCIAGVPDLTCPLCRAGDRKTYRMFLSVLDLSEYESRQGKKVTKRKRLLAINQGDKDKWQTLLNNIKQVNGTLRGAYIYIKRPNEQRSSRIGEPTAVGDKLFQKFGEPELKQAHGHKAVVEGGKVMKVADDDITPLDYDRIFPYPDEQFIAAMEAEFGNGVPQGRADDAEAGDVAKAGSASDIDQTWSETIEEGATDTLSGVEMQSVDGLGANADGGDEACAQTLTEVAAALGIEVDPLPDWTSVEVAIAEAQALLAPQEPEPEPAPPPKPAPRPGLLKPGIVRPGVKLPAKPTPTLAPKPGPRPVAKPAPAPVKPALPLRRPGGPAPANRPNRTAFGD